MTTDEIILSNRIVIHPNICHGKPRIKGTRIFISLILEWLAEGASFDEIIDAYPTLTRDDIRAVLDYSRKLMDRLQVVALGFDV